jgi:hypothetical protein
MLLITFIIVPLQLVQFIHHRSLLAMSLLLSELLTINGWTPINAKGDLVHFLTTIAIPTLDVCC